MLQPPIDESHKGSPEFTTIRPTPQNEAEIPTVTIRPKMRHQRGRQQVFQRLFVHRPGRFLVDQVPRDVVGAILDLLAGHVAGVTIDRVAGRDVSAGIVSILKPMRDNSIRPA